MIKKRTDRSGYKGNPAKWRLALSEWQDEIIEITKAEKFDFFNFDGSKNVELLSGKFKDLPKSYLDFIEAGGNHLRSISRWGLIHGLGYPGFLNPGDVDLFRNYKEYTEYNSYDCAYDVDLDEDYFKYSGSNAEYNFDDLENTIIIGEEGPNQASGVFLINPIHISVDNEWEGWSWLPHLTGTPRRYPSFAHLVAQKYVLDLFYMDKTEDPILYWNKEWESGPMSKIIEKSWVNDEE